MKLALVLTWTTLSMISSANSAVGQAYPSKPMRIVTAEPGGGGDFISRTVGQGISPALQQPVIVQNRGGGGVMSAIYVARMTADGYTLLCASGVMWIGPLLQKSPYDPVRDFSPVTLAISVPNILVVNPALPVTSVKELVALAMARPGSLNYAGAGSGGSAHLAAELFKSMARVDMTMISYRSAGPAMTALVSNEVQVMFASATAAIVQMKSGKAKPLAVTSAAPSALVPDLPTVAASGLPGYESATITGFFTPAGTPGQIIRRLNVEINRVLAMPDVKDKILRTGGEPVGTTPEEYSRIIKAEIARMGKVIRDAGIRAE